MPIGFSGGDLGGSSRPGLKKTTSFPLGKSASYDQWVAPAPAPADGWEMAREAARDAGAAVAAVVETLIPVTVEVWVVLADGRACPECGPYDGSLWDEGDGPQPPLHPNCRCRRTPHHVEWRVRP